MQTAVNALSDGATLTFAAGSYAISGIDLGNRNGITLICASVGGCTITTAGDIFVNSSCVADKTNLMRISGFNFTGNGSSGKIWLYCSGTFVMSQVRIDHNDFSIDASQIAILFGESSTNSKVYGVVDHNTCHGTSNFMCMKNISGGTSAWVTGAAGGANAMFFEDNTCNFTSMPDNGTGCVDVWRSNSTVIRFNTMFNGRMVNHSYCHEGPYNSEVYGNTIDTPDDPGAPQFRNIHFQGSGEEIAFGNTVETDGTTAITIQHFRGDVSTATSEGSCNSLCNGSVTGTGADAAHANDGNRAAQSGYPCWHQPGRDGSAVLKPVYIFMNHTVGGTKVGYDLGSGGNAPGQFQADRDAYVAVSASAQTTASSPFDGTTGMGFGTLARRPTTCTATAQATDAGHGGVGYWATDQGSWNSSGNGFGSGVLYTCTATNTWTLAYTPYTYPHPLTAVTGTVPPASASFIFAGLNTIGGKTTVGR